MKNIDTSDKTNIYITEVNNETKYEYEYLNAVAINSLTIDTDYSFIKYLGCYDKERGVTFFGKIYNDQNNLDGYGLNTANSTKLLPAYSPVANGQIKLTKLTSAQQRENQIIIKNYLKNKSLNKVQVAAIMGNIYVETIRTFDPLIRNRNDKNQSPSVGLIQWNGLSYGTLNDKNPSYSVENKINEIYRLIGTSVSQQLDFLFKSTHNINIWLNNSSNLNVVDCALLFAKVVEVCADCGEIGENLKTITQKDRNIAKTNSQVTERLTKAVEYLSRFDKKDDPLYWDYNTQINTTTYGDSVTIGDSISIGVNGVFQQIQLINSPVVLSTKGWTVNQLINALNKTNITFTSKNLVLSIGSNDLWVSSDNLNTLISLVKQKFPSAKYYILNGSYGWDNLSKGDDNTWKTKINNFINVFKSSGFNVVGSVCKVTSHPGNGDNLFNSFKTDLSKL